MKKREATIHDNRGFTLVEILVASGIGIFMLIAIYAAINTAQLQSSAIERRVVAQQDERGALELMAMEVRMASYNPNYTLGNWLDSNCGWPSPNQRYNGIQEATPNALTIEMDINEDCTASNDNLCMRGTNEVIRYNYDAANMYITRTFNCAAAAPFLGDTAASGRTRNVRVINDTNGNGVYDDGVDVPLFRYFNGQGAEITAAMLPAGIPDIRTIEIALIVETDSIDASKRRTLTYSTRVIPRNHLPNPNQ